MRKKKGFEASQESVLDMWRCGSCPVDCGVLLVGCCSIRAGNHQACRLHCTTACMSLPGNGSHAFAARPCSSPAHACYQNKPDGSPQPSRWPVCDRDDWSRKRTGRQIRRGSELHMHACMQPPRGEQRTTTTERAGRRAGGHGRTPGDRRGSQQYQYFTAASYAYDHRAGPWTGQDSDASCMHGTVVFAAAGVSRQLRHNDGRQGVRTVSAHENERRAGRWVRQGHQGHVPICAAQAGRTAASGCTGGPGRRFD